MSLRSIRDRIAAGLEAFSDPGPREGTSETEVPQAESTISPQSSVPADPAPKLATGTLNDDFFSLLAHELRNPLAPILTWTQLIRSGTLDREKSARALAAIERSVQTESELIDQLLEFSRLACGPPELRKVSVDLASLLAAAAEAQRPVTEARQVRLQLVTEERATLVAGDPDRLQRTMSTLISNAVLATPEGGSAKVVLRRIGSQVEISVSDSGAGLNPSALATVFAPVHPDTDGSMRRRGKLSLGLSIARHVVLLHGGDIVASSEGADRGSTFTVRLPLLTAGAQDDLLGGPQAVKDLERSGSRRLEDIRVLVVDTDASASEALRAVMRSRGADVRIELSAQAGLATLQDWRPHVLVSGVDVLDDDGLFLVRELRKRGAEDGGEIPALALTGMVKSGDRVRILDAGYQSSLMKPADPNELVAVVESLAGRNSTRGESKSFESR